MPDTVNENSSSRSERPAIRHDWTQAEAEALFALPFGELIFRAQALHRTYFDATKIQLSNLLSIKTGGCPEDCAYCPQSAHYETGVDARGMLDLDAVMVAAREAKNAGADRFCMGAAWRGPRDGDLGQVCEMIQGVGALGLETCVTLGMLGAGQAERLKDAGLDYYNHNLDTSATYYAEIITTRTYRDRLDTLQAARRAGLKLCAGGIVGMGETVADRAGMLVGLANLAQHPETVPINLLVRVDGTPLADGDNLEPLDFVRAIAAAKVMMPASVIRLSAGREEMSDETQALCFLAGAGSVFLGERLLTTGNPAPGRDEALLARLGLEPL